MSALNNQTNRNSSRYFFATSENGEQTLGLQYGTTGGAAPISTMAVTISGSGGNGVVVTEAPCYLATEFILAEDALMGGTNSTYNTLSSINTSLVGFNIGFDRQAGSGTTCIESYAGNGAFGGYEFLSRGVNSQLVSTTNVAINNYVSSIGRPGATAVLGASGTFVAANSYASAVNSLDVQTGGAGRGCFTIQDLSGANGVTPQSRWSIGTSSVPSGGNTGSDFTLFSYTDAGTFLGSPIAIQRATGAMRIDNISSISAELGGTAKGQVFPMLADNVEFGAPNDVAVVAGASNQATPFVVLFSTPVSSINANFQTLLNINFANSLSSGSNHVNYKLGFSTGTAYTNIIQTSYVPGLGGSWTPSDLPGSTTPIGHTNICCTLDSDGITPQGDGFLYVMGQLSDPNAPADQIYIAKGQSSEPTRNAFTYKTI